uniref:Uncharacterized protein n=1 Tax=Anopheles dirus TaxID=7168 RepID=A0A182NIQ8_9DIPT
MDKDTSRRVTVSKTLDEVRAMNARNDKLLKDFGIDPFTLADPAQELLEQYAQIRHHTGLSTERPELSCLKELLYQRETKRLEGKLQAITLRSDIDSLRLRCASATKDVARLECFLAEAHGQATSTEAFEKKKASLEQHHEIMKKKIEKMPNIPDDIKLDELIANIRRIEEEDTGRGGSK